MKNYKNRFDDRGFTLIELMITVAIIGILGAVAYPSYTHYVEAGNRADGTGGLLPLAARMEEFYMNNDTYDGATINNTATGTVGSNQTSKGLYTLSITTATAFSYTLTATPVKTDAECGNLLLDSLGQQTDSKGNGDCW